MTSTLFDVYEILGLAVDGEPVTCRPINDLHKFKEDNLSIVPTRGNLTTIKHSLLQANFRGLPPDASPVKIVRYTRAYLLFLINVTIFANALVATVPTRYLQFCEDIEQASKYTWSATTLLKKLVFSSEDISVVIWNLYFKPDEAISDDRHEAFQTTMCITTLIFDDIAEPYMSYIVCRQFGAKQGIPINPLSVGKRSTRHGGQRDWRNINSNKIHH
ncbi:hypothetical protein AMTR_s00062p00071490 [Amborella trichopoda]|uniref:Aminotransferase-like plant mobile domain-containing protein n=1 Tax=Amborella trichopoda TaxID=13333 RepID=U5DAM2_AMBTC|nr:hypothetical protein AMTR_s00062p00071490 [Amborella trichopoda]